VVEQLRLDNNNRNNKGKSVNNHSFTDK